LTSALAPIESLLLNKIVPQTDAAKSAMRNPWAWIPTLYVAEGLPYALVMSVAAVFYKNLGVANHKITLWVFYLGLPWIIKPLWSPVVDILKTRREWIYAMQIFIGALFTAIALAIPAPHFIQLTLALFMLIAFSSASHDIAADGFYILALPEREQALFSGVRNTFYRVANIAAQGLLVVFVGKLEEYSGNFAVAWAAAFTLMAAVILALGFYHRAILPRPTDDVARGEKSFKQFFSDFGLTFVQFFQKPKIAVLLAFILLYRFGEAQLLSVANLFLLDPREKGGLGLTDSQYGWIYGTVGVTSLLCGGLLGGYLISRNGLKIWLWPMLLAIHLPDVVFIWLAYMQPQNLHAITTALAVEQFGYGFGFTAFMLYLIYISRGEHATAHYAICTGFMALGLRLPSAWSGWLQEHLGYQHFFIWVILATVPGFIVTALVPLDAEFGRKARE
jgi:PAT family beta-lactamase induction signal transducer AmpG